MGVRALSEWAKANPWKWAFATAIVLFLFLFAFGVLILDQTSLYAAAFAGAYALVFALFTAAANAYRSRRSGERR